MCYHLTTNAGNTEAVIDDNCGVTKFYAIAQTLAADLQIKFLNQVDDSETLNWDFHYQNQLLTLHYNIYNGVSVFPLHIKSMQQENNAVLAIAQFLEHKVF